MGYDGSASPYPVTGQGARRVGRALYVFLTAWLVLATSPSASAADVHSFAFRTNDVIAFVGGEDVVEMQHNGYLELLLTAAKPELKLRFRYLAFEGDTVFEQHRQLNFPSWEQQLERVGATVVIAQFGQAESLPGTNGLARFEKAYSQLLDRFTQGGRRLVLLSPTHFEGGPGPLPEATARNLALSRYVEAIRRLAVERGAGFVDRFTLLNPPVRTMMPRLTRDGVHLHAVGHWIAARDAFELLGVRTFWRSTSVDLKTGAVTPLPPELLRQRIVEKNRLWFDYWRPQNWAFLNGDRTDQPSSHDHRDPKKRWFPEEMEKFLPLIEAQEREIWKMTEEVK